MLDFDDYQTVYLLFDRKLLHMMLKNDIISMLHVFGTP